MLPDEDFDFQPYHYKAQVVSVYDADTITLEVDEGHGNKTTQTYRLHGIDAWELRGSERSDGLLARDWLGRMIPVGSTVFVRTVKDKKGKYGRYLAVIYKKVEEEYFNLNKELMRLGHAESYPRKKSE